MAKFSKLWGLLAFSVLVSCKSSPPMWVTSDTLHLHVPSWLRGNWRLETRDNQKQTRTVEDYAIYDKQIIETRSSFGDGPTDPTTSPSPLPGTYWYTSVISEATEMLTTIRESTPSDFVYRIDLDKDGQPAGFFQFEKKGDVLVLSEKHERRDRTIELHPNGSTAGATSPSPMMSAAPMETPYFSFSLPGGWEKIDSTLPAPQWEVLIDAQRKVGDSIRAQMSFERTAEDVDLETAKNAWVANAGTDATEVTKTEVLGLSAYRLKRNLASPQGPKVIHKYLVAKDGRVYSFGLVSVKDDTVEPTLVAEFEEMVKSVRWTSSSSR